MDHTALTTDLLPRLIELRRDLHRQPELGFQEEQTRERIRDWLTTHGWVPRIYAETGLAADLHPGAARTIALRADMDALPMAEGRSLPHHSRHPGRAHKCGHDGHMAILLGVATILARLRERIPVNVRLLFQPAEEGVGQGGAKVMIDQGVLAGVDEIYGLHNWPGFPQGEVRVAAGPVMARVHTFELTLTGKGGHGSQPQVTRDPLAAGAQLITALQTIRSRSLGGLEQAVFSVCSFQAGTSHNIIPDEAEISGTFRTFEDDTADRIVKRLEEIVLGTAAAMGVEADLRVKDLFPALVNHREQAEKVRRAAAAVLGEDKVSAQGLPLAASEDFARFTQLVPGAYFFLGAGRPGLENPGVHHPDYDFNDEIIGPGVRVLLKLIDGS